MGTSFNKTPLTRIIIPFIVGIIASIYIKSNSLIPYYIFLIFLNSYLLLVFNKKTNSNFKYRWLPGVLIYINFFLVSYNLTSFKIKDAKTSYNHLKKSQYFIGEIIEKPELKKNSIKLILNIKNAKNNNKWKHTYGKVITYLKKDSLSTKLNLGDYLSIKSNLKDTNPPKNIDEFNYKKYLSYHFIYLSTYLNSNDWKIHHKSKSITLTKISENIREKLINALKKKGLNNNELAVASALILGYKHNIDPLLKQTYSSAGAMHVLAVSGLHVGVIYLLFNILLNFLNKIKYGNYIKAVIIIIILWIYALITGLSPSILRAATMFSFIVIGKMLNRNTNIFNTIAASAFILLIINPLLIMEVGFQLSYAAVLGIIIIQPWIYNLFNTKWWLLDKIWVITTVSIAAQLATFPLSLLYFHQFPNYFLLSNLIVIPLTFSVLYLGLITICSLPVSFISDYLILSLKYLVRFLNWIVITIEQIPYSLSIDIRFNVIDTWIVYFIIGSFTLLIAYRKFNYFLIASISCIFFIANIGWRKYKDLKRKELVIYNIPYHSIINLIDNKINLLITDKQLISNKDKLFFHVQNNWTNKGLNHKKAILTSNKNEYKPSPVLIFKGKNFFQFYNYKIASTNKYTMLKIKEKPIVVDLLILNKYTSSYSIKDILQHFNPKEIVIDASLSISIANKWEKEASAIGIKCFSVLKEGTFTRSVY